MWRDFPQLLADHSGWRVVAYSREGYGASSPYQGSRAVEFLALEATRVLPAFLKALSISNPVLVGHSDGATIALLGAAYLTNIRAVVAMAPHLFVEDISVAAITRTKANYIDSDTGLREKLSKFHVDVDAAFFGWADIWLTPAFRQWNVAQAMVLIKTPLLAIQGEEDQYGTMLQLDELQRFAPQTQLLKFDQSEQVLQAINAFLTALPASTVAK
jgi:pimeloyl-ACP methyl ester carboxylesterase